MPTPPPPARRSDSRLRAARPRIGVELGAELIEAGDRHRAVGGDVLPAIGERGGDIGRSRGVAHVSAGLEQVGMPAAAIGDTEKLVPPPANAKPAIVFGEMKIVGADRGAGDVAGGVVRSDRRIAVGRLRTAEARGPHAPARFKRRRQRRLGEHRKGVGLLVRGVCARLPFFGIAGRARRGIAAASAIHERIGHHAHELVHGVKRGLLRAGRGLAGDLRQTVRRQSAEHHRNAAGGVEKVGDGVADRLLIAVQATAGIRTR